MEIALILLMVTRSGLAFGTIPDMVARQKRRSLNENVNAIAMGIAKDEPDLRSADVNIFKLVDSAVSVCNGDGGHLAVHVVLGFDESSSVDLSGDRLACYNVALGLENEKIVFEVSVKTNS